MVLLRIEQFLTTQILLLSKFRTKFVEQNISRNTWF